MTTWSEVEAAAPELAAQVRGLLSRSKHKTMATLRRDGSPRISGTETEFGVVGGRAELTLGMMPGSVKLADVRRDPRVALHSTSIDPPDDDPTAWPGEAKVAGRLRSIESPGEGPSGAYFALDVAEVVCTTIADGRLLVRWWTPAGGERRAVRG